MRIIAIVACIFLALAVVAGAFGAHFLKVKLTPDQLQSFETGVRYHFYHSLALLIIWLISRQDAVNVVRLKWSARLMITGILLFSGSIYILATSDLTGFTGNSWLGPITPVGGLCLIMSWIIASLSFLKKNNT